MNRSLTYLGLFGLVFFYSCNSGFNKKKQTKTLPTLVYQEEFFINDEGDSIPFGLPISIRSRPLDADSVLPENVNWAKSVKLEKERKEIVRNKLIRGKEIKTRITNVIVADSALAYMDTLGKDTLAVEISQVAVKTPKAISALEFRSKDNAVQNFQYLSEEQGLQSYSTQDIYEDKRANLWIATRRQGVIKYDGERFYQYTVDHGLSSNTVRRIYEDSLGRLYFIGNEIDIFDGKTITHLKPELRLNLYQMLDFRLGKNELNILFYDFDSNIYLFDGNSFSEYPLFAEVEESKEKRYLPHPDKYFAWWYPRGEGVAYFDGTNVRHYVPEELMDKGVGTFLLRDSQGNGWYQAYNEPGFFRFTQKGITYFSIDKDSKSFNNLFGHASLEDSKGNIWFAFGETGICYLPSAENLKVDPTFKVFGPQEGLPREVTCLFEDSYGNIWAGTNSEGIFKLKLESFTHITTEQGLPFGATFTLSEDDQGNLLFLNSSSGIFRFDGTHIESFFLSKRPNNTFKRDRKGNIWMGMNGPGVIRFNEDNHLDIGGYNNREGLAGILVREVLEDKNGNIWVAADDENYSEAYKGQGGLTIINPEKGTVNQITRANGLMDNRINSLYEDRMGNIWFGSGDGLIGKFEPALQSGGYNGIRGNLTYYHGKPQTGVSKEISLVRKIYEDRQGRIWFSTSNAGLWVKSGENILKLEEKHGINAQSVRSIFEDEEENIWVATLKGLNILVPTEDTQQEIEYLELDGQKYRVLSFGKADGLREEKLMLSYQDRKNLLWWGAQNGLVFLDKNSFEIPNHAPQHLTLTQVDINEEVIDYNQLSDSLYRSSLSIGEKLTGAFDSIAEYENYPINPEFRFDLNHLSFHVSTKDWIAPHKVRYSYFLQGIDKEWSQETEDPLIEYRNLPHGNYSLQVKAIGTAQIWTEPITYPFTISPPWWLSWWAKSCYALLGILAVYGIIYWRTHQSRKKLSEAQQLNVRLRQVDELKDQFLANTSHELRTPLHGMVGLAEALFDKAEKVEDRENLSMLVASGKRLSSLVNDLLDFSKVKNHDLQLSFKALSLRVIVDLVIQSCRPLLGNKEVDLVNNIPDDLALVYADENRLQQILYNLIGNAIKFTESGKIELGVSVEKNNPDEFLTIFVKDSGIGIPLNKQEKIFKAFEQADGSAQREFGGTGLGLSITRQLVELHGGEIWLESQSGEGSCFYFRLPIADKNIQEIDIQPQILVSGKPPFALGDFENEKANTTTVPILDKVGQIRILLVDDEPINHQVIKNYFEKGEIYLRSVMNGHEALEVIQKEEKFDLILLDIMMPRMNGYEVCREIRKQYLASEMPVIMLTAKNQISDLVQGLEIGANDYIAKPFSKDEFLARIKTHINLHKIHSATHKFVPTDFLRSIDRENITEVRLGDQKEQYVTVFFSDIRAYTGLSESMTPEENFKFVNAYAGRMGPLIRENKGFVNQYLGDGIMAIFQQSPGDALQAAVGMQRAVDTYNIQRKKQGRREIEVGMGLHAGPLIMGVIGDEFRNDSATISDTVNTASRMEGLTKHFGVRIIISESVYESLPSIMNHNLRYLGLVQVKGRVRPIKIYDCLDAYPKAKLEKIKYSLEDFHQAMELYFKREFAKAAVLFRAVLDHIPKDKATQLYLERCASYMVEGVAKEWEGIEHMQQK